MDLKNFVEKDAIIEQVSIMNGRLLSNLDIVRELRNLIDKKIKESKGIEKEQERLFKRLTKLEQNEKES